jgi:hypothetical protein
MDPRAFLDDVEKILDTTGTRTPTPRSSSPAVSHYIDCAIPALPTAYKIHNFIINSEWEEARGPNESRQRRGT